MIVTPYVRELALRLEDGLPILAAASLDVDGASLHLASHGLLAVDARVDRLIARIGALIPDPAVCFKGSADEALIAAPAAAADGIECALRAAASADEGQPSITFTAAISSSRGEDVLTVIRGLDASNRAAVEALKAGGPGAITRHRVCPTPALPVAALAATAWEWCLAGGMTPSFAKPTEFESALRRAGSALLIVPAFGGLLLNGYEGRGVTHLRDGLRVGKLGFLNGLFGEHLTSNLLVEPVLAGISALFPDALASARLSSGLAVPFADVVDDKSLHRVALGLEGIASRFDAAFGPGLRLAAFRCALLDRAGAPYLLDSALQLARMEAGVFRRLGLMYLNDLRGLDPRVLSEEHARQRLRALSRTGERGRP